MHGVTLGEEGDRLVIRPGIETAGGPFLGLAILGGAFLFGVGSLVARWEAPPPELWPFVPLNVIVVAVLGLWLRASLRPFVLDRAGSRVWDGPIGRSLHDLTGVALTGTTDSDGDIAHAVELVFRTGDRYRLNRSGWRLELRSETAARVAGRIADYLEVSLRYEGDAKPTVTPFATPLNGR